MNKRIKYLCGVLFVLLASIVYVVIDFESSLIVFYVIINVFTATAAIFVLFTTLYFIGSAINILAHRN
ncbi:MULTISPECIES: hypothetical protein [Yersiniaceae]|uniref:Uncharacterized protein n=1 Tax=Yersinia proxima TaxID=2890316 RepID=A0ABW9F0K0_9GAMM|nr:hypothetical protein [Serratia symbiotica]QTP14565.1 hypothetical protein GPZ83_0014965 [Serratia symbiotica]